MASISTDSDGLRRILFVDASGKRRIIYMGRTPAKDCETVSGHIERIVEAQAANTSLKRETAAWLGSLGDVLHAKLVAKGLAEPRQSRTSTTLGVFTDAYISARTDIKPNTEAHLRRARGNLVDYFGADREIDTITAGDADEFRQHLLKTMADNTVRRICGRAKQFFRYAVRKRLIAESPFGEMKAVNVRANKEREVFVTRDIAQRVLDACPDAQWRAIFALCRFGGLRCPSEVLALTWGDVDLAAGRMRVPSPKTAHHEGGASRMVPIFPELRPYLEDARELAETGSVYVITRYRQANVNLRTQLERIIYKAGLEPWEKPFQNLRSTRETELAETYPIHVCCAWLGNSQAVARKHYLQVTDEHFQRAGQNPTQNPTQQPPESVGNSRKTKTGNTRIAEHFPLSPTCTHVQAPRKEPSSKQYAPFGMNTTDYTGLNRRGRAPGSRSRASPNPQLMHQSS